MTGVSFVKLSVRHLASFCLVAIMMLALPGCGFELPEAKKPKYDRFDLSKIPPASNPSRPAGVQIADYAVEYVVDLGVPAGQPGHNSEVRVVLPSRMPAEKVPALIVNGAGAFLFSGMVLSDEDIEPMLPYVEKGFAIVAYETDGCQPDFTRNPTPAEMSQMTRQYIASKAGLINATRALSYALDRFPEIDAGQLYAIGHSSGGKQALLLSCHDERIRGCVAFAPACRMDLGSKMTVARIGGPDGDVLEREVKRSMPIVHAKATNVPILLIFSPSDEVTRPAEVLAYAKAVGETAKILPVRCGGHGQVPEAGFPLAVTWLHLQSKLHKDTTATNLVSGSASENVVDTSGTESEPTAAETPEAIAPPSSDEKQQAEAVAMPQRPDPPAQTSPPHKLAPLPTGVQRNPYFD